MTDAEIDILDNARCRRYLADDECVALLTQAREANRLRELPAKIIAGMKFIYDEHCASKEEAVGMRLIMGQVKSIIEAALEGDNAKETATP
jgi:hypothetical protein